MMKHAFFCINYFGFMDFNEFLVLQMCKVRCLYINYQDKTASVTEFGEQLTPGDHKSHLTYLFSILKSSKPNYSIVNINYTVFKTIYINLFILTVYL